MNCEQIREQLVETARGRTLSSDVRAVVFAHVEQCPRCEQRLETERHLTRALSALALDSEARAPLRMEHAIRRQVLRPRNAAGRRWFPWWAWASFAAVSALAAMLTFFSPSERKPLKIVAAMPQGEPAAPAARAETPKMTAVTARPPVRRESATPKPRPAVASSAGPVDSDGFVRLPYADDLAPEESAAMVHVQLARESLLALGVPVMPDRLNDQIQADVLVGMDGVPRAIRLLD